MSVSYSTLGRLVPVRESRLLRPLSYGGPGVEPRDSDVPQEQPSG